MKGEKIVFFTIVDDLYYYPAGCHIFVNSFKRFHPDIDLVVFRQDVIDRVMKEKQINFYQAKPTFAKLLSGQYDLVVNIDCDHIILDRLTEVVDQDYEVGGVWNYNAYENASFDTITDTMYVQAGMVASRNPEFWDIWERKNKQAMQYLRKENDILNLVWYNDKKVSKMKRLIWDKDIPHYLGCKSLGQEHKWYIRDGKVRLNDGIVKAYHHARGRAFPKLDFDLYRRWGVRDDVINHLKQIGHYGQTVTIK